MGKLRPGRSRGGLRGSLSRPTALSTGSAIDTLHCSTQRVSACCPLPRRHRCQGVWEVGPLISHIIFGISHSLGELENVIVKVFLNICLLSRKML